MSAAIDMRAYADAARPMLGVVAIGAFEDDALRAARRAVMGACRDWARDAAPVVVLTDAPNGELAEAAELSESYPLTYRADGTRWLPHQDAPVPGGTWSTRDPAAADQHAAVASSVLRARALGRRAQLLVLVGTADEAARAYARELSRRVYVTGAAARVEYLTESYPVIWLDTETTCRAPNLAGMIEVGAVACSSSSRRLLGTIELRIKIEPWMRVEQGALDVNGYDPVRWAREGLDHDAGVAQLLAWLPRRFTFGAYNVGFDRSVVRNAVKRAGGDEPGWEADTIDPMYKVRSQLKAAGRTKSSKLVDACDYYGVSTECAHTALWDAHAARLVYLALLGEDISAHAEEVGL